ncbi:MAG TPA: ABC transporter ATP-binding protein [Candidatus Angelobacter sp.]
MKPLLQVNNLTKRYGRLTAVDQVSFSVREGEILGLIGPNGAGKTTVFESLGGVLPADQLEISHEGRPLGMAGLNSILFYLPDAITPWPSQTVNWALDFTVGLFGGRADLREDVVRRLELASLLDRSMGKLSKGQRKRALLALGVLAPQPVLMADEPFEGLDLRQTREVASALRSYAGEGKRTMVLSIHQIADAARVCDRFVLLSGGKLCGEGTLAELSALAAARSSNASPTGLEEVFLALT